MIQSIAPRYGGPSAAVLGMCRAASQRGVDVEVYSTNVDVEGEVAGPLGCKREVQGVQVTLFPVRGPRQRIRWSWPMAQAMKRSIRQFDIVHIHSLYNFPGTLAAHLCRRCDVPYLLRPHGTLDPYHFAQRRLIKACYERVFERRNLAGAAAVHFTSDEELRLARKTGIQFEGIVIPLGVDAERVETRLNASDLWPELRGKRRVVFMGRIDRKKGIDLLMAAFAEIARSDRGLQLVIAGPENDDYGVTLRRLAVSLGIADHVTFTGMVSGENKAALFRDAAMFVLPSHSENFGVAIVEAMVAGVPVIASRNVNLWREIVDAGAGLAVDLEQTSLASAMRTILADLDYARELGRAGHAFAADAYSWNRVGELLVECYRRFSRPRTLLAADALGQ